MHKNLLWQAFLAVVFLINLGYSSVGLYRYYVYSHLTEEAPVSSIQWSIVKKADDEFLVEANYQIIVGQQSFNGKHIWSQEPYLNHYAAEEGIKGLSKQQWKVWYNPSHPDYSSLYKQFPFKEIISAVFLWALFLYFLWLGFYVAKFKT